MHILDSGHVIKNDCNFHQKVILLWFFVEYLTTFWIKSDCVLTKKILISIFGRLQKTIPCFLKIKNFEKKFQPLQDFQDYNFEEQYTINLSAIRFALPDSLTQTVIYDTLQKRKLYVRWTQYIST